MHGKPTKVQIEPAKQDGKQLAKVTFFGPTLCETGVWQVFPIEDVLSYLKRWLEQSK